MAWYSKANKKTNPFATRQQYAGFQRLASTDLSYQQWVSALGEPSSTTYGPEHYGPYNAVWSATWTVWSHNESLGWIVDFDQNFAFASSLKWVNDTESFYRSLRYVDLDHPIFPAMRAASTRSNNSRDSGDASGSGATQSVRCGKCRGIEAVSAAIGTYKCKSCGTTNRVRNQNAGAGAASRAPQPPPQQQRSSGRSNRKMRFRDEARCQCNDCGRVWFYTKADRWKEESKSSQNSSKSMMCCTGCAPAALIPNQQVVNLDRCPDCGSRSFTKTVQQLRG